MSRKITEGVSPETGNAFTITETSPTESVEISMNAKGEMTVSVKVYDEDMDVAQSIAVAAFQKTVTELRQAGHKIAGDKNAL